MIERLPGDEPEIGDALIIAGYEAGQPTGGARLPPIAQLGQVLLAEAGCPRRFSGSAVGELGPEVAPALLRPAMLPRLVVHA
jgi:hypothetical protein